MCFGVEHRRPGEVVLGQNFLPYFIATEKKTLKMLIFQDTFTIQENKAVSKQPVLAEARQHLDLLEEDTCPCRDFTHYQGSNKSSCLHL